MGEQNIYNYTYQDKSARARSLTAAITIAAIIAAGIAFLALKNTAPGGSSIENLIAETTNTDDGEAVVVSEETETPDEASSPVVLPTQEAP